MINHLKSEAHRRSVVAQTIARRQPGADQPARWWSDDELGHATFPLCSYLAFLTQRQVLRRLADLVVALDRPHPIRVAIDGIDAAGKTTLSDALAPLIRRRARPVIRASVDGFHWARAERYRLGAD